jgi:tetratricopeptide (TPR) repeat protein
MNRFGGAGFYGDVWGILPFVIGATLPERYNILQIEPIRHINHTPSVIDKNKEEYDKAISDYTQVLTIYPYYAEIYNNRGNAYFLKGEYDKAISDYTQALRIDSKDIKTYQKRGTVYIKNREYDKAIFDFDQAIRINPKDVKAYHNRAVAYSGKGEYDKAWEDVKKLRSLGFDINPAFLEQLRRSSGGGNKSDGQ